MCLRHYGGKDLSGLIHHSDRGVQYASYAYTARLKDRKIGISMTESGNPKDNAVAERVNNTIKNEFFKGMEFYSMREVRAAVKASNRIKSRLRSEEAHGKALRLQPRGKPPWWFFHDLFGIITILIIFVRVNLVHE